MSKPIPTLLQHLLTKFDEHLAASPDRSKDERSLDRFAAFAEDFLDANPVTEYFYPGQSVGFRLANSDRVVFNRMAQEQSGAANTGQMQDSGAIEITDGSQIGRGLPI